MSPLFFDCPVLNSPDSYPARYWEFDESRQPTNQMIEWRRLWVLKSNAPDSYYQSCELVPSLLGDLRGKIGAQELGLTDEAQRP